MSFKHQYYTIEHVLEVTNLAKQKQVDNLTESEKVKAVLIDGLWLYQPCADIVNELRKKHKDLKIGVNRDTRHWGGLLADVVVYREGESYALGRIGYGDVGISTTEFKYYILSRKLRKGRGGWGRWQNYIKASVEMKNVLKLVNSAFVSYAPAEVANMSIDEFTHSIRRDRNAANNLANNAWRAVASELGNELRDELCMMVNEGYQFRNHKITERIAAYIEAEANRKEVCSKRLDAYFMIVGSDKTTVIEYEGMENDTKAKTYNEIKTEDIPFDLQLKLASLQVATPMNYVEDLGMRVSDMTFWVQR